MKYILGFVGFLIVVGFIALVLIEPKSDEVEEVVNAGVTEEKDESGVLEPGAEAVNSVGTVVQDGEYVVNTESSTFLWAGQKPNLEGYINSGSIALSDGEIVVSGEQASGSFTIDMDTLSVSDTPKKPGKESALESHLKGERWFDVGNYSEATFTINEVTQRENSAETFVYDVTGVLSMKGVEAEIAFPAKIYLDEEGYLRAEAEFEFDRTKWGVTASSGSFFDNLADNVVSDMVAVSFSLVAEK